jgi:hypothetical protein
MQLLLQRAASSANSTIGELFINGKHECYTLEDVVRPVKLAGVTAIPAGDYEVVITYSERFKCPMPLLLNVPNYSGVRIHVGNYPANTEGCILVGQSKGVDQINNSKAAFSQLFEQLTVAAQREKIFIKIV